MRFVTSACPQCKGDAVRITECVFATAGIARQDDGHFDYDGSGSTVIWDTQEPVIDGENNVELQCEHGHLWKTKMEAS